MNWLLLDSRMLAAVAYEEQQQILYLGLRKTGDVHRYLEFPGAEDPAFLVDAESRGRFFLTHIRDHFRSST